MHSQAEYGFVLSTIRESDILNCDSFVAYML